MFCFVIWVNQHLQWSQHLCEAMLLQNEAESDGTDSDKISRKTPYKVFLACILEALLAYTQSDLMQQEERSLSRI